MIGIQGVRLRSNQIISSGQLRALETLETLLAGDLCWYFQLVPCSLLHFSSVNAEGKVRVSNTGSTT